MLPTLHPKNIRIIVFINIFGVHNLITVRYGKYKLV